MASSSSTSSHIHYARRHKSRLREQAKCNSRPSKQRREERKPRSRHIPRWAESSIQEIWSEDDEYYPQDEITDDDISSDESVSEYQTDESTDDEQFTYGTSFDCGHCCDWCCNCPPPELNEAKNSPDEKDCELIPGNIRVSRWVPTLEPFVSCGDAYVELGWSETAIFQAIEASVMHCDLTMPEVLTRTIMQFLGRTGLGVVHSDDWTGVVDLEGRVLISTVPFSRGWYKRWDDYQRIKKKRCVIFAKGEKNRVRTMVEWIGNERGKCQCVYESLCDREITRRFLEVTPGRVCLRVGQIKRYCVEERITCAIGVPSFSELEYKLFDTLFGSVQRGM